MTRHTRTARRRGVVLLVILSLLVLFALLGVTFAIVASQYSHAAKSAANYQRFEDEGERLADQVMYMVVREPRDTRSALYGQSLLRDMYGTERAYGSVVSAQLPAAQPDLLEIDATAPNAGFPLSNFIGAFNGCVLTFTNGNSAGQSTRIVNYFPPGSLGNSQPTNYRFVVERLGSDSITSTTAPQTGSSFIVNGKPFNGTGLGYDSTTGTNTKLDPTLQAASIMAPLALLPNYSTIPVPMSDLLNTANLPNYAGGDADESYDAIDYNNPFLAGEFPNNPAGGDYRILDSSQISPSYHNRALANYWVQKLSSNPAQLQEVLRRAMFRPLPFQHPNFTGSNVAFTQALGAGNYQVLVNGPWDVDNDGDGVPDSVWIDVAFPLQRTKDGKLIKPLAAIKILDLGGRANVNAHGHLAHLDSNFYGQISSGGQVPGAPAQISVNRGQGYGPPEVNLQPLLGNDRNRIIGNRYFSPGQAGQPNYDDYLSQMKNEGLPSVYPDINVPTNYANPPDVWGRGAIVVNLGGLPVSVYAGTSGNISVDLDGPTGPMTSTNATINETMDDPYELNLVSPGKFDRKYTPAEFERYLRYFDVDSVSLPVRLVGSAATGSQLLADPSLRSAITTESFDVPVPPALHGPLGAPQKMYSGPYELFAARLQAGGINNAAQLNLEMSRMFPFELLHGQKFDLNRAWGNGKDDPLTGNQQQYGLLVTDDAREVATVAQQHYPNVPNYTVNGDYRNDTQMSNTTILGESRQLYARHLYVMAMMLVDDNFLNTLPSAENLNQAQKRELAAQRIAQWAVNVVDFRDPDSIMTAFEYDINPFNGWQVDGNLATDGTSASQEVLMDAGGQPVNVTTNERRFVFGCEAPDLLITETINFHDRKVRDTDWDDASDSNGEPPGQPGKKRLDMATMKMGDKDLDQFRIPEATTLIELFCTGPRSAGTATTPMVPRELYNIGGSGQTALDLGRMAPTGNGGYAVPVWRLAIGEQLVGATQQANQVAWKSALQTSLTAQDRVSFQPNAMNMVFNDQSAANARPNDVHIERIVWFANQQPHADYLLAERGQSTNGLGPRPVEVYYNRIAGATQLPAGSYGVVGPRAKTHVGSQNDRMMDSPQTISITGNSITVTDAAAAPNNAPPVGRAVLGMIAAADPPTAWTNAGETAQLGLGAGILGIGLGISDPLPSVKYYKEPTFKLTYATGPNKDAYVDPDAPMAPDLCPDVPEDASDNTFPLGANDQIRKTGTLQDFRSVYLQRLADPTVAWNPLRGHPAHDASLPVNPYITVDFSTLDLTVFNGEDKHPGATWDPNMPVGIGEWDKDDADPFNSNPPEQFSSRHRGVMAYSAAPDIYAPRTTAPVASNADGAAADPNNLFFNHKLTHSLGSLNPTYGNYLSAPPQHIGDPQNGPHPWMAWNNRPFANHMELLLVPSSSPGRLLHEYAQLIGPAAATNAPLIGANPYQVNNNNVTNFKAPYGHLLNFFHTSDVKNVNLSGANLARLLDLVEVPSRFVGAEKFYQPTYFAGNSPLTATYRPPYAKLSRFRDPGKININTMTDPRVWQAISYGYPDTTTNPTMPYWNLYGNIDASRKNIVGNSAVLPSEFPNPFRSASAGELVPLIGQNGDPDMRVNGVEASLLRSDPSVVTRPLFSLDASQAQEAYRNHLRNPYFRYQGLQKIGNIVGTQSNTFAMWITIGYFEVENNTNVAGGNPTVDANHPDGYRLGQEVGADSGQIKRHRSFYMIDRSIPVGFEPGENHNVDRAVLLRRFIE